MKKILAGLMTCLIASGFTFVNQKQSDMSDTTPPVIEVKDSLSLEYDSDFDLNKYINIKDNLSKEVTIGIAGSVNTSKSGKYLLTVTATDKAGNMSVKNIQFTVKPKPEPVKEEKKEEVTAEPDNSQAAASSNTTAAPSYTPSYTPPVSTPTFTPPVQNTPQPSESNSQPAGGSTYYEDEDSSTSSGNGGVYGSEGACRAEHSTGQCIPFVGADGSTVQGYIWSN